MLVTSSVRAWCALGVVAAACVVPDVELVDQLPGAAGTNQGGVAGASSGAPTKGGTHTAGGNAAGGDPDSAGGSGETVAGGAGPTPGGAPGFEPDDTGVSCTALSKHACRDESCCSSTLIPGCPDCFLDNLEEYTVSPFRLDKYEVTVGRFRAFVEAYAGPPDAQAGAHPNIDGSGWQADFNGSIALDGAELNDTMELRPCMAKDIRTWTPQPGDQEQKPINCLTWFEAFAFCIWDGGFLPTDLEWQFAATGGDENRTYPWVGQNLDVDHALYGACGNGVSTACNQASILEVGSKLPGAGKWQQLDVTGSMWEWTLDRPTPIFPFESPCIDCANLTEGSDRSIRGGSWFEDASYMPAARRLNDPPGSTWYNVGIRCARPE